MTKVDENIKAANNILSWLIERCYNAEEENKTLKWNVEFLHRCLDDREGSLELMKEENERLENEINNSKSIWNIIANCVILSFFCFLFAWVLCIWFMMIADAIMWFKFVVFL